MCRRCLLVMRADRWKVPRLLYLFRRNTLVHTLTGLQAFAGGWCRRRRGWRQGSAVRGGWRGPNRALMPGDRGELFTASELFATPYPQG